MSLNFNLEQARAFLRNSRMNSAELTAFLWRFADRVGRPAFRNEAAAELMKATEPEAVLPEVYAEYRPIVRDGIFFLFSHLSLHRLIEVIVRQLRLDDETTRQERLIELARQIPTLHKLGQTIARNRHITPEFRGWLVQLEHDTQSHAEVAPIRERIEGVIGNYVVPLSIEIDNAVLSEASVGVVVGFSMTDPSTGRRSRGVFKVLKPGVRRRLHEEFDILDRLAAYFDQNRERYTLEDFRFIETFHDVKQALQEEIDLRGEQRHLREAARRFRSERVIIPELLSFSGDDITAMMMVPGEKITDADLDDAARKACAATLFESLIWTPLFSTSETTLFHGDPHAGNLFAAKDEKGEVRLGLLDWSLTGTLTRTQRMHMIRLILSILTDQPSAIRKAISQLSGRGEQTRTDFDAAVERVVREVMAMDAYHCLEYIEKAFYFIDRTAIRGIRYPKDLLLFRKTFFTLDGVLRELDPDFSMNRYMFRLMESLVIEELPSRMTNLIFPPLDFAGSYKSLISNSDLQLYMTKFAVEKLAKFPGSIFSAMSLKPGRLKPTYTCVLEN